MNKKTILFTLSAIILFIGIMNSCSYKNKETLLGSTTCDTINTKFGGVIMPIITTQCNTQSGCHGASAGSITLETYQEVKDNLPAILDRINRASTASGFMPKNNPKLDACSISQIQTWSNRGALNN
jgi:hypothetical protein